MTKSKLEKIKDKLWIYSRRISGNCGRLLEEIQKYSVAITALSAVVGTVATIAMAIFAATSWIEVKRQRQLVYSQLRNSTLPDLAIRSPSNIEFTTDHASTNWQIDNRGGLAKNVDMEFIIAELPAEGCLEDDKCSIIHKLYWPRHRDSIGAKDNNLQYLGIDSQDQEWLKKDTEDKTRTVIVAFSKLRFRVPPVFLDDKEKEEIVTDSFWWNGLFGRWMSMSPVGHANLEKKLMAAKFLVEN